MSTKTTTTKAKSFMKISKTGVRPATGGNKNVTTGAKRQGDQLSNAKQLWRKTDTAATMQ